MFRSWSYARILTVLAAFSLGGCQTSDPAPPHDSSQSRNHSVTWTDADNPNVVDFNSSFNYSFAALPIEGEAEKIPWAGSYWPTYRDSVNYRWDASSPDSLSPAEKYAQAFGKEGITDAVSVEYGVDSMRHRTPCTTDAVCNASTGEECSKRQGSESGFCVETWFGICHAWGPAAVNEPEPKHSVIFNGVEFKINDIKALVTLSYDHGLKSASLSETCEVRNTGGEDGIQYNEWGIPTEEYAACADTNAGTFHVVIGNMLGLQRIGLVEDRTYDYEVWNQPLRGYKIWKKYPKTIDAVRANSLLGATGNKYLFNPEAVDFRHIKLSLYWITESHQETDGNLSDHIDDYTKTDVYEYIVELDATGNIIGGEWVRGSQQAHPDFLWAATEKLNTEVAVPAVELTNQEVVVAANEFKTVGTSTGFPVTPGDKVKITMSGSADADLSVRFKYRPTETKFDCRPFRANSNEECVLEAPAGTTKVHIKVNGGAAGDTVTIVASKQTPGSGIEWVDVKQLLDLSVADPVPPEETSGFNWGSPCDGGSGSFQQAILQGQTADVGEIPSDKHNVRIDLVSDQDVDIQLYDGTTPIVMWDEAETAPLHGAGQECTTYEGLEYCYSGYEGDGTNLGHEWIQLNGNSNRTLTMKAFGYAAGNAQVNYQWAPLPGCIDQGSGTFTQLVERRSVVDVGVIPEGKQNLRITLTSDKDVDIQLFDGAIPIVMWDDAGTALLHGETQESTTYKNMMITYSGYNGDGTNYGNEFITVLGEVSTPLTMKAFGYAEGEATVDYAWGLANSEVGGTDEPAPPDDGGSGDDSSGGDGSGGDGSGGDGSGNNAFQGGQP